jgi:hypothetical protein
MEEKEGREATKERKKGGMIEAKEGMIESPTFCGLAQDVCDRAIQGGHHLKMWSPRRKGLQSG